MKMILQLLSWLALAGVLVCTALFFTDRLSLDQLKAWLVIWTVVWFVTAPFWMEHHLAG